MGILTADQIRSAKDRKIETVHVPEWGGDVCVRSLTAAERGNFETVISNSPRDMRERLCFMTICNEAGDLIFQPIDLKILGEKSAAAIVRVFDAAFKLSGFGAADVEELEKNSEASQADGSPSA